MSGAFVILIVMILTLTQGAFLWSFGATPGLSDLVRERLRHSLTTAAVPADLRAGTAHIQAVKMLPRFYEQRDFLPAWSTDSGPSLQAETLLAVLREAKYDGLMAQDYHLQAAEALLSSMRQRQSRRQALDPDRLATLDLLLTDAFLIYGTHLLVGRVNPETIQAQWYTERRKADVVELLQTALTTGRVVETLELLRPPHAGYARLRQALARYRAFAARGGWPVVPDGPTLRQKDHGPRVATLRARLRVTGDLDHAPAADAELFDAGLEQGVRRFQQRHGLEVDGIVGAMTLQALNVPAQARVRQITANLERWRWLPQYFGQRYILVNIANFGLEVIDGARPVLSMRVIVGKSYQRTPVFSASMTYLVLNPSWHVPHSIATKEILPDIRKDPAYLATHNMRVYQGWGAETRQVDPHTIVWSRLSASHFPYRLRQMPGPENPLGRIKFMFPNRFNVYLHDTPARGLFTRTVRTFSHGCIRIAKPLDLATYVLRGDPRWTREALLEAFDQGIEQRVQLPEPVPVYVLYWTAWVEPDGTVHFRRDIYERDTPLENALRSAPPSS
jgi:murein L,D-transpeptidase YcbB/YkuD